MTYNSTMSKSIKVKYIPTGTWASFGRVFWLECQHDDYEEEDGYLYCDYCDKAGVKYTEEEFEGYDDYGNMEISRHTMIEWLD